MTGLRDDDILRLALPNQNRGVGQWAKLLGQGDGSEGENRRDGHNFII